MYSEEWLNQYLSDRPDAARRNPELLKPQTAGAPIAPPPSVTSEKGCTSREKGAELQDALDGYHRRLESEKRVLKVLRTDPRIIQTGPTTARVIGKGPVDYIAFGFGMVFHFDAKSTSEVQGFSIGKKAMHQLEWLRLMAEAYHKCGYVVEWTAHGVCCWHPVETVDGQRVRFSDGIRLNGVEWMEAI